MIYYSIISGDIMCGYHGIWRRWSQYSKINFTYIIMLINRSDLLVKQIVNNKQHLKILKFSAYPIIVKIKERHFFL